MNIERTLPRPATAQREAEAPDHRAPCRVLLGENWSLLAAQVRAVHERRPITLRGVASVVRGRHPLARLAGWIAGLPRAQDAQPVHVRLEREERTGAERWTRRFASGRPMRSTLRIVGDAVEERFSALLRLRFHHVLEGGSIRWHAVEGRTLGLRWPDAWLRGIEACESVRGERYWFDVRASLPRIGLLVHYVGVLEPEAAAPDAGAGTGQRRDARARL